MKAKRLLWVIGGGLLQIPLIQEANALGLGTIVSDINPNCPAREFSDYYEVIDVFDIEGHCACLKEKRYPLAGVLAAGIDAPETMAAMNEFLGLKGVSLEIALLTKHKDRFRKKLKELAYPTPEFVIINALDKNNIAKLIKDIPFPLIVKPCNNSASRDMKIFNAYSEALETFIKDNLEKYPLLLVEQMWQGEEQTVECLIDINGSFHQGFITDRIFQFTDGYPVETGLVHPSEVAIDKQQELFLLAKNIAYDLGIDVGAVKLDTIYTTQGPRIIELTVRHSGGFDCQYLVPLSTGKNILRAAILTAIQQPFSPKLLQAQFERYGQTASPWPKPGVIQKISGIEQAKKIAGVEDVFMRYQEGDRIEPYINCARRVAFVIATGKSREQASLAIQQALSCIDIQIQ